MNKTVKNGLKLYIYIADFNLIKNLYKYKTIFSCAFLRNSKMYV